MIELLITACMITSGGLQCNMPVSQIYDDIQSCQEGGPLVIEDMVTAGWIEMGYPFIEFKCVKAQ